MAAICARIFLGMSIDYFGVRRVWLCMSLLTLTGACIFASMNELTWLVYAGRICFVVGLAGMFTCGTFHMQDSVTEHRRTEFIALLGSSGFLGMIFGSQLAGYFRSQSTDNNREYFQNVFTSVITLLLVYVVLMLLSTRGVARPIRGGSGGAAVVVAWPRVGGGAAGPVAWPRG